MRRLIATLFSSLMLLFAGPVLAGPDALQLIRRDEGRLLNQALSPAHLGSNLRVLDMRTGEWLTTLMSDPPAARILVLHLWTAGAGSDIGWLRDAGRRIEANYGGDVRFLFVTETTSGADVKNTLGPDVRRAPGANPALATPWPMYLDNGAAIAESLRPAMLGGELHLPITLLIDSDFVVRYAMVGSIAARRAELASAIADLLRQAPRKRPAAGTGPEGASLTPAGATPAGPQTEGGTADPATTAGGTKTATRGGHAKRL